MQTIYPLKFSPIFKEKLWGGHKINHLLGKDFSPLSNCGELWAVSAVDGNVSTVAEGPLQGKDIVSLIESYQGDLIGNKVYTRYGTKLPLLIKFLDAAQDLSIQVHPDDRLAQERHGEGAYGKTEMWYILQADEDATLITGFNQPMEKEKYIEHFNKGNIEQILNQEKAEAGDVFFIPAGRVHTIGKGLLLAEIQQTSDITYRIYDFDRKDANGELRELHTEAALDAIDYKEYDTYRTDYQAKPNKSNPLVSCPYFHTSRVDINETLSMDYSDIDSFVIYIGIEGSLSIVYGEESIQLTKGEAIMVPASLNKLELVPDKAAKVLETYIP